MTHMNTSGTELVRTVIPAAMVTCAGSIAGLTKGIVAILLGEVAAERIPYAKTDIVGPSPP